MTAVEDWRWCRKSTCGCHDKHMCRTADVGTALLLDTFAINLPVSLPISLQSSVQTGSRSVHIVGFNLAVQVDFDVLS